MSDYSCERLNSRIAEIVNTLIANGEIKNPGLSRFASVNDIYVSKDKAYAKLYVWCIDEKALESSVAALQAAAGFIQSRLGSVLKTRNTPKLTFIADETERNARRIDELLELINESK